MRFFFIWGSFTTMATWEDNREKKMEYLLLLLGHDEAGNS